jgi:hypothetical protein
VLSVAEKEISNRASSVSLFLNCLLVGKRLWKSLREREREEKKSKLALFQGFRVLKFFVHMNYYSHTHSKSGLNGPSDRNNNNTISVSRDRFF